MDSLLRSSFNSFLGTYFEPLGINDLQLSMVDGLVLQDIVMKPDAINAQLKKQNVDLRVEEGQIALMRVAYSALSGQLTMNIDGMHIRVSPNTVKTVGKVMVKSIGDYLAGTGASSSRRNNMCSADPCGFMRPAPLKQQQQQRKVMRIIPPVQPQELTNSRSFGCPNCGKVFYVVKRKNHYVEDC